MKGSARYTGAYRKPSSSSQTALQAHKTLTTALPSLFTSLALAAQLLLMSLPSTSLAYDGFAEYAQENQMDQSDVACFVTQCGPQTKALFSNPRGIQGIACLGKCKGAQACATQCFAAYGSETLNEWLSCTIEDNECVKVPKPKSQGQVASRTTRTSSSAHLADTDLSQVLVDSSPWYKTDGWNPNYDLFDCQTNNFHRVNNDNKQLDIDILFRVPRPEGGGFWENRLTEHMNVEGNTLHTQGKMYGLTFEENWEIVGMAKDPIPYVLVAYEGQTLQGKYQGAFVYAKEPVLPDAARPAVAKAFQKAGLDFKEFQPINNACPIETPLNEQTDNVDWLDLVVGQGGIIDWIRPGWRGEYNNKQ